MRKRTKSREYALQLLYQVDIRRLDPRQILEDFWEENNTEPDVKRFTQQLVLGAYGAQGELDPIITQYADNWQLKRMAVVDRNILRLGVFELLKMEEIPPSVCINEAIELAKRFGDADSAKFINGILDAIHKAHGAGKLNNGLPAT